MWSVATGVHTTETQGMEQSGGAEWVKHGSPCSVQSALLQAGPPTPLTN